MPLDMDDKKHMYSVNMKHVCRALCPHEKAHGFMCQNTPLLIHIHLAQRVLP